MPGVLGGSAGHAPRLDACPGGPSAATRLPLPLPLPTSPRPHLCLPPPQVARMIRAVRQIASGAAEMIGSLEQNNMAIRMPDGGEGGTKGLKFTHAGEAGWRPGWLGRHRPGAGVVGMPHRRHSPPPHPPTHPTVHVLWCTFRLASLTSPARRTLPRSLAHPVSPPPHPCLHPHTHPHTPSPPPPHPRRVCHRLHAERGGQPDPLL